MGSSYNTNKSEKVNTRLKEESAPSVPFTKIFSRVTMCDTPPYFFNINPLIIESKILQLK